MTEQIVDQFIIRESREEDHDQLKALWCDIFEEPPEIPECILRLLPGMGSCCVAELSGKIVGCAYLIHGFTLLQPGNHPPRCCGYLYAVGVYPEARHRGIGTSLCRGAVALGTSRGAEMICCWPAEPSLYKWYEDILSLRHICTQKRKYSKSLPADAERLSAMDYQHRREKLLQDIPHLALNDNAMQYHHDMFEIKEGGLFHTKGFIFCAYQHNGRWVIPEVIPEDSETSSEKALPDGFIEETVQYVCSNSPFPEDLIYNLTFD